MGKEKYICPCFKVTCDDIRKAVEDGADSFKKVKKATKVSGKCGHCECRVKTFTKEMLKDVGKETSSDTSQGNKKSEGKKNVSKKNEEKKIVDKKILDKIKAGHKIADRDKDEKKIEGKVKAGKKTADRNKEDKKIEGKFKAGNKKSDKDKKHSKTKGKNKEGKIKQGKIKQGKEKKDKKKAGKNLKGERHNPLKMKVIKLDDKNYKVKNIK